VNPQNVFSCLQLTYVLQLSTIVLKVRLIRGCVIPLRLGMLCCQNCCVVPAMISTSPADKVVLIFLLRSMLCLSTKSLGVPNDTDAMFGLSPYLQASGHAAGCGKLWACKRQAMVANSHRQPPEHTARLKSS
jgi:hypothetical protein